ncbi:MAG TPA: GFA family protein [Gaiellaceae bacterium]|nr:GFA family protein [Gaiellaceae bacterium]
MEGGCACGEVRYRLRQSPLFVHCCHCLNCQRQTGAAFAINMLLESEYVESLGSEPERVPVPRSGAKRQQIYRCPTCKTAVWSTYTGKSLLFVRAGTLDDPAAITPDVHIYTRSKVPWLTLPESTPAFTSYYDMQQLWPPESLERLAALRAG